MGGWGEEARVVFFLGGGGFFLGGGGGQTGLSETERFVQMWCYWCFSPGIMTLDVPPFIKDRQQLIRAVFVFR